MEEEKAESYRALYRVRPLIYHIGDIRLWVPIRQDGIILWFVYIGIFFVLCYLIPILAWVIPLDRTVVMVIGPIAAAYYSVKLDPAGKTVPRFLKDLLGFHLRPKWTMKWKVIRYAARKQIIHFQGRCRSYVWRGNLTEPEEWCGNAGRMSGTVQNLASLRLPAFQQVTWHGRKNQLTLRPDVGDTNRLEIPCTLSAGNKHRTRFSIREPVTIEIRKHQDTVEWHIEPIGHKGGIHI